MTAPAYISTLGSAIESNQPIRDMFETLTQEYLNQGGKITQVGDTAPVNTTAPALSPYNKKVSTQNKKKRDSLVEDVVICLEQGMIPSAIQSKLKITHWTYSRILKENNLEEFAKNRD